MNGPDTIVPGSSSSSNSSDADGGGGGGGGGGDVIGRNMTIPPSVRYYSCNDEVVVVGRGGVGLAGYYFIYYHYILPMLTGESG